jgi:hypothetical protein
LGELRKGPRPNYIHDDDVSVLVEFQREARMLNFVDLHVVESDKRVGR